MQRAQRLSNKPWYLLFSADYGDVYYEKDENGLFYLHLDLQDFSLSTYKQMHENMCEVLTEFNRRGIEVIHVLIPADDPQLLKFEEHMGFIELHRDNEHNFILLGQETKWD